jgi:hypothetical protein
MMQQPFLLSPKFGAKSLYINVTVVCRIDCLACQDEFFVNDPHDIGDDDYALDFAYHLSFPFRSALNRACHSNTEVWLLLSSPNACLIIWHCTKFDAHSLLDPWWNHIRPETQLQIKGHKKWTQLPSCMKFCTLTPKLYSNIIISHCIVLLQLLYEIMDISWYGCYNQCSWT